MMIFISQEQHQVMVIRSPMKELTYSEKYNWLPTKKQAKLIKEIIVSKRLSKSITIQDIQDIVQMGWFISHGPEAVHKVKYLEDKLKKLEKIVYELNMLNLF